MKRSRPFFSLLSLSLSLGYSKCNVCCLQVQTAPKGTFPVAMGQAVSAMITHRNAERYPFGSLQALWSRQIPYTMAKFYFFEKVPAVRPPSSNTAPSKMAKNCTKPP